jgi:hypothetical protein
LKLAMKASLGMMKPFSALKTWSTTSSGVKLPSPRISWQSEIEIESKEYCLLRELMIFIYIRYNLDLSGSDAS